MFRDPSIIISEIVSKALTNTVMLASDGSTVTNPKELNCCRTRVLGACLGLCAVLRIKALHPSTNKISCLEEAFQYLENVSSKTSKFVDCFYQLSEYERICLDEEFKNLTKKDFSVGSLMGLYEYILSIQFMFDKSKATYISDKTDRNRLGSYYTPDLFADICVKYTLNEYIKDKLGTIKFTNENEPILTDNNLAKNLLLTTKYVDFSCGTGKFLVALTRYFDKYVLEKTIPIGEKRKALAEFVLNINGIDVDYLALEIAKIELSLICFDSGLLGQLDHNFRHGNPLIPDSLASTDGSRMRAFNEGRIYNANLGINLEVKYDIVVGNPPWEKVRFEEKNFFRSIIRKISSIPDKESRSKIIKKTLSEYGKVAGYYGDLNSDINCFKKSLKNSQIFKLTAKGEPNTYSLFTELALNQRSPNGMIGLILKSGIVTSQVNKMLFSYVLENNLVHSVFDFINRKKIFDIDSRERFCFLVLGNRDNPKFKYAMGLSSPEQIFDTTSHQQMSRKMLMTINPITNMLPNITDKVQIQIINDILDSNKMFYEVYSEVKFGRIVHLTNHSSSISQFDSDAVLPIFEGKFIEQYDGRYSGFNGIDVSERFGNKVSSKVLTTEQKKNPLFMPESRFYIKVDFWRELTKGYPQKYSLMWRSLTSATNKRTCIATILPHTPTSQSIQLLQLRDERQLAILLAVFNSLIFDYLAKAKLNGIDLTKTIITQIPVPPLEQYNNIVIFKGERGSLGDHIIKRVCALLGNDVRLDNYMIDLGLPGYKRQILDGRERIIVQREIDVLIGKAYRIGPEVFEFVKSAFQNLPSELLVPLQEEELYFLKNLN